MPCGLVLVNDVLVRDRVDSANSALIPVRAADLAPASIALVTPLTAVRSSERRLVFCCRCDSLCRARFWLMQYWPCNSDFCLRKRALSYRPYRPDKATTRAGPYKK